MKKEHIRKWINLLQSTLLITEAELSGQENFTSHTQSSINNLKRELDGNEIGLNESTDDPTLLTTIEANFTKSLLDISKRINELRYKPMSVEQIEKEFRSYHETNFNILTPVMASIPFGYSITKDPQNISQKIYKTWAVKSAGELEALMDSVKDMFGNNYKPLDITELHNVTPIYFVIHSN